MRNFLKLDWLVLVCVFLLLAIGMMALYSVSTIDGKLNLDHFNKQLISIAIGLSALFFFTFYDYRVLNYYGTKLYFGALAILLAVLFFGTRVRGTEGWIGFGNLNFQPVELVKLIMIIFLASFLSKKKTELSGFMKMMVSMVLVSIPVFLIFKQPDFGSSAVIIGIWFGMLLVSGITRKNLMILGVLILALIFCGSFFLKGYQRSRLINFVDPYNDPKGSGYNVIQSTVAVGSGKLWGKGLGQGSQSQLNFLPEKHTDFIFAVIAEELGLVGAGIILLLFGVLLYRMKKTAELARDNFGHLIVVGITLMFFLQIFVNVGMNIGFSPVAGVPLPLLSFGGSSLITVLASVGIIQSVYTRRIKTLD